jgi:ACT domain-containing protein
LDAEAARKNALMFPMLPEKINDVLDAIKRAGLSRDEFYARCGRLSGFGLVAEVKRNDMRMSIEDYCYRVTGRGAQLVEMIGDL